MLHPPEPLCIERVRSRTGHGFTDLDAACHTYREFSLAKVADRLVIPSEGPAEAVASSILEMAPRLSPPDNREDLTAFQLTIG